MNVLRKFDKPDWPYYIITKEGRKAYINSMECIIIKNKEDEMEKDLNGVSEKFWLPLHRLEIDLGAKPFTAKRGPH